MNTSRFTAGGPAVEIARAEPDLWHALDDGRAAGHGEATTRPDGRIFLTVDAWHRSVFDQLAGAMLTDLPGPLHTVVDGADHDLLAAWRDAGLTIGRREWDYVVPTAPARPAGVTIRPATADDLARQDWELRPVTPAVAPPSNVVAVVDGESVGLLRVVRVRVARIDLVTVRATHRRRGIGRALVTHALGVLHGEGVEVAYARVDEADVAATALVEGLGGRRAASTLELVRDGR
ncbi:MULTISPECIES: GNAT family N-acetyltransferase [unclassified Saccharothrix]|uniref:GNAT family N-acetyltransferase n=1 Tax=unclassified Saccharothrix TaxID=2593673 RepID=UPI00307F1EE6